jgi:hypothetical protein
MVCFTRQSVVNALYLERRLPVCSCVTRRVNLKHLPRAGLIGNPVRKRSNQFQHSLMVGVDVLVVRESDEKPTRAAVRPRATGRF